VITFGNKFVSDKVAGVAVNIPAVLLLTEFGLDINGYWRDLIIGFGFLVFLLLLLLGILKWRLKEKR
jgi:hypothetical protein